MKKSGIIITLFVSALFNGCDDCKDCNSETMTCQQVIKNATIHSSKLMVYKGSNTVNEYTLNSMDSLIIDNKYPDRTGGSCPPFSSQADSVVVVFNSTKKVTYYNCSIKTPCDKVGNILESGSYQEKMEGKNKYRFTFLLNDEAYNKAQ